MRAALIASILLWPVVLFGQVRTWTDNTGEHKTEAEFVKVEGGDVHLKKPDGSTKVVPLNRLSDFDRAFVAAQRLSPKARKFLAQSEAYRKKRLPYFRKDVENQKKEIRLRRRQRTKAQNAAEKAELERMESELAALEKNDPAWAPPLDAQRLEIGAIGVTKFDSLLQSLYPFKVLQVIDEANMLVSLGGRTVWFKGYATAGLTDDVWVTSGKVFEVTGTKGYTTVAGGTKTVLVIQPLGDIGIPIYKPEESP